MQLCLGVHSWVLLETVQNFFLTLKDIIVFTLDYISTLLTSWPPVSLLIVILFRRELSELIKYGVTYKVGDREISVPGQQMAGAQQKEKEEEKLKKLKAETAKARSEKAEAHGLAKRIFDDLRRVSGDLGHERIYNTIFGSQIKALERLRTVRGGVSAGHLRKEFYEGIHLRRLVGPSLGEFPLFMGFLKAFKLVEYKDLAEGSLVRITKKGVKFLDYIEECSYSKVKPL